MLKIFTLKTKLEKHEKKHMLNVLLFFVIVVYSSKGKK
jgi:ABC-type transport system involved in cytochrome c biogenesis permease component